jgi:MFS family permease
LITWLGTSQVIWLNAASFVVSAALIGFAVPGIEFVRRSSQHYLQDVREGLAFIRHNQFLVSLLCVGGIANFAGAPLYAVVLPVFARETYGHATDLGLLLGGVGAGSLLGAILYGMVGAKLPRRQTALVLSFLSAAPVALLAFEPPVWIAFLVLAVAGLGDGYVNPLVITVIYERVPAEIRGRVLGSMIACILAAAPFGMLIAGWAVNPFGIDAVVLAIAAVLLLVTALFAVAPGLHDLGPASETDVEADAKAAAPARY